MLKLPKIGCPSPFRELILKGYELVPEAYCQKFRSFEKLGCQTYLEFARSKEQLFDRWCHSQKVDKYHDKLRQLILIGEFERCIHSDVRTFIDEQKVETLEDTAWFAEECSLSHKVTFVENPIGPIPLLVKTRLVHQAALETKEATRVKIRSGNRILVTTLQIVLTSPGQDKMRLRQVSLSSHLHAFIVEEMDI